MLRFALVLAAAPLAQDTTTLSVTEAFERARQRSYEVVVARARADASEARARAAAALPDPTLVLSAENLGREREITGLDRWGGVEGQVVLQTDLPFGPTRSGTQRAARADAEATDANVRLAEQEAAGAIIEALGGLLADETAARSAEEEFRSLDELARALRAQADEGRAAEADATRALLERGLASTQLARARGAAAVSRAEVVRLLGLDPETVLSIDPPVCDTSAAQPWDEFERRTAPGVHPTLERARARAEEARGAVDVARGLSIPDVVPQVGLRRGGGYTALYLGIGTDLPLFGRGARATSSARADVSAAEVEVLSTSERLAAAVVSARTVVSAMAEAGAVFDAQWMEGLDRVIEAAETRWALGEGSLFELLDAREVRLQAVNDRARWQLAWWTALASWERAVGRTPGPELFCVVPNREDTP